MKRAQRPIMKDSDRKKRPCAACGKPVGAATIVAGGEFPDAPLCMRCGTVVELETVYEMIRERQKGKRDALLR